ncbi:MAG: hypothetical protein IPH45_09295 [Bacteroidales bacterium]|nr:hypothetical protein [Bacteroidales bacterium]
MHGVKNLMRTLSFTILILVFGSPLHLFAESRVKIAEIIYKETSGFNFQKVDSILKIYEPNTEFNLDYELAVVNYYWWKIISGNNNERYSALLEKRVEDVMAKYSASKKKYDDRSLFLLISICAYNARVSLLDNSYLSALGDLSKYYSFLKISIGLENRYAPFLLTTGLYNYFYGLARERYPLLSPVLNQFQYGNKELGIVFLKKAALSKDWKISQEATYFLMKIAFDINSNYLEAEKYCRILLSNTPGNILYQQYMFRVFVATNRISSAEEKLKLMEKLAVNNSNLSDDERSFFVNQSKSELVNYYKEH